ncbi:Hypothetical predicted protein [Paramuricea clavata]|uniref:Uncharacterized protein n=1 Tax=Paramuricea clavata TaxID=317549 RepID=A0A7D9IUS9_PARCT|nr:Hypothetical predicted protein [Paramuricea clavata]
MDDSIRIIIIATTVGAGIFLGITLIVLLIKYKRLKRASKLSTPVNIPLEVNEISPQPLPVDEETVYETVPNVDQGFHKDVATNANESEDISAEGQASLHDWAGVLSNADKTSGYETPVENEHQTFGYETSVENEHQTFGYETSVENEHREFYDDVATNANASEDISSEETSGEYWIKELSLKNEDKTILKSQRMLNDRHMNAAQKLLKKKFPHISGLQDTILSQTSFVNTQGEGIQIHNTEKYHWITSASIGGHVRVCDSRYDYLAGSTKVQLAQCYQNLIDESGRLEVDIRPVQTQTGSVDCGLFAIAFAYELTVGHQPVHLIHFDQNRMRSHLLSCFEKRELTHFPQASRQPATQPIRQHNKVKIATLCDCKLPEKCNCALGF